MIYSRLYATLKANGWPHSLSSRIIRTNNNEPGKKSGIAKTKQWATTGENAR